MKHFAAKRLARWIAMLLTVCLLMTGAAMAETGSAVKLDMDRVTFLLQCNEGMNNDGGNVGNTMMVVSFDPELGNVRLLMFTWDTFVNYPGYDVPQLIDQPYRMKGPAETMMVFNANFGQHIERYLSVNYLNLANLIDAYGGVNVDVTRAERNALNGMVASKKEQVMNMAEMGVIERFLVDNLVQEYYLQDWGEDTHLNGLQAVGYGWLQYDSVYNCCLREVRVIADLFNSVGESISRDVAFYTNATDKPEGRDNRRAINLDEVSEQDMEYLYKLVAPIFDMSYNNLTKEEIVSISVTLAKAAYLASRQGVNVFGNVEYLILPLEALEPYDRVAGRKGHLVDYEANTQAITEFLYGVAE